MSKDIDKIINDLKDKINEIQEELEKISISNVQKLCIENPLEKICIRYTPKGYLEYKKYKDIGNNKAWIGVFNIDDERDE